jgi:NADH:ubiquinone oxidoreductase subunit 6 (subunit J)
MTTTLATALINWNDLWKIIVAALIGGTGVVIVFGLLLLGISRGKTATKSTRRYGLYSLSALCGVLAVAVACLGVYAMTQRSSSAKPKPKTAARTMAPVSATQQRAARTT